MNKFDCCFELPHKGIYLEVKNNGSYVSFDACVDSEVKVEVCLRKDDIEKMIGLLQTYIGEQ